MISKWWLQKWVQRARFYYDSNLFFLQNASSHSLFCYELNMFPCIFQILYCITIATLIVPKYISYEYHNTFQMTNSIHNLTLLRLHSHFILMKTMNINTFVSVWTSILIVLCCIVLYCAILFWALLKNLVSLWAQVCCSEIIQKNDVCVPEGERGRERERKKKEERDRQTDRECERERKMESVSLKIFLTQYAWFHFYF